MRQKALGMLLLVIMLAACGGDKDKPSPTSTSVPPTSAPSTEGTEEAYSYAGQQMEPGVRVADGLEVVSSNTYVNEAGIGWIVLEIKNGNDFTIPSILVTASLLDGDNREWETQNAATALINIPAGYSVPIALEFVAPPNYSNFMALVSAEGSINTNFTGEYDLPGEVNAIENPSLPLRVTGSMTNDRDADLFSPLAILALYAEDGTLLGVAQPVLTGTNERGRWAANTTLTFEAVFTYLPSLDIAETRLLNVGYRTP